MEANNIWPNRTTCAPVDLSTVAIGYRTCSPRASSPPGTPCSSRRAGAAVVVAVAAGVVAATAVVGLVVVAGLVVGLVVVVAGLAEKLEINFLFVYSHCELK